jgi:hypothetical protein
MLSGMIPYHYLRTDALVIIELHNGVKPRRPAPRYITDEQWAFIERCWSDNVEDRPNIEDVCEIVQDMLNRCGGKIRGEGGMDGSEGENFIIGADA